MSKELLVALDGSALSEAALPHAIALAERLDASLLLVRVHTPITAYADPSIVPVPPPPTLDPAIEVESRITAQQWLDERAAALRASTKVLVRTVLRVGNVAEELTTEARESHVWAIICTTHGSGGWAPEWLGSICDAIIRLAPCPVFALSNAATGRGVGARSILVPLDGTSEAELALSEAIVLARAFGARIELFRVVAPAWVGETILLMKPEGSDPLGVDWLAANAKSSLDCVAADLRDDGLDASAVVAVAHNATRAVLRRIADTDPDLVVVTSGLRGISRLLVPSLADRVLRAGGRPTLFVHRGPPSHGAWRDIISAETAVV